LETSKAKIFVPVYMCLEELYIFIVHKGEEVILVAILSPEKYVTLYFLQILR
jgi:hypothetical protein